MKTLNTIKNMAMLIVVEIAIILIVLYMILIWPVLLLNTKVLKMWETLKLKHQEILETTMP